MNFLKSFSDIFEFKYSVNLIELEKFFSTIEKVASKEEIGE